MQDTEPTLILKSDGTPFGTTLKIGDFELNRFITRVKTEIGLDVLNTTQISFEMVDIEQVYEAKNVDMPLDQIEQLERFLKNVRIAKGY